MRRLIGLLLLATTGCAGIPAWISHEEPVYCVATYIKLASGNYMGLDRCGNTWIRTPEGECWMLVDSLGGLVQINCPAEGETLAVVR